MKKLLSLFVLIFMGLLVFAQAPQKFSYQAVVRDAGSNLVSNHAVGVQVSILQGGVNGAAVYVETHAVTTNANCLMTLEIGGGTVVSGDFASIDWSAGSYFLKTETDPNGGTNYTIEGTQQLLSVPYALYAANSANSFSGDYNDLTNQPQIPEIPENVSAFANDAGYITMDSIPEIPTVPTSISAFTNDAGYLTSAECGNIDFCDFVAATGQLQEQLEQLREQLDNLQAMVDSLTGNSGGETPPATGGGQPCPGNETVTDIDGNVYNTVQIGNQCWMRENLRTTRYANNTEIPASETYSNTDPYRYAPDNNESNVATYGYLYNWPAVMHGAASSEANPSGVQGICPTGWHVPSDAEWTQLTDYVSSQSQYVCGSDNTYIAKALATATGWEAYSTSECVVGNYQSSNNATNFSALPAGVYYGTGYGLFRSAAVFYSTSALGEYNVYTPAIACSYELVYNYLSEDEYQWGGFHGFSVRCLRDEGSVSQIVPTVTTNNATSISTTSATCGGNVTSDGGASVTARGVCWSTSQNPTTSSNHTTDGSGTGTFTSSLTGLTAGTTYYVRAYATNSVGTVYGNEVNFTTTTGSIVQSGQPCPSTPTLTDIDGNVYNTVQIGSQCWMKENLRTTKYADNIPIPLGDTYSYTDPYRYALNNDEANVATYGYLYNWLAVMHGASSSETNPNGVQGICPDGWHVPSDAEWTQLTDYVSSQSEYVCGSDNTYIAKSLAAATDWYEDAYSDENECAVANNQGANNATGFSALPAGFYDPGDYYYFGHNAYFWSATAYDDEYFAYKRYLYYNGATVNRTIDYRNGGFSVRCLRD